MIRFHRIFETNVLRGSVGIVWAGIIPGKFRLQDIAVNHFVVRLLQSEEEKDGFTEHLLVGNLASRLNKRIHIPCPDLGIATAGVKTLSDDGTRHTIYLMKRLVVADSLRQFQIRVRSRARGQKCTGHTC